MPIVNVTRLSQVFRLTTSRIHQLVKEGMPQESRGRYDFGKCMLWYIYYLQRILQKKNAAIPDSDLIRERKARLRLLRAEADLKELQLAKKRASLITTSDADRLFADLVLTTRTHFLAIPALIAPEIVGESSQDVIQDKIETACKNTLRRLAASRGRSSDATPGNLDTA